MSTWRELSGADDAKLVLIGHSMGGLISRYFLECLDGWRDTRALVTFGTPYRGSVNALDTLVNGKKIKFFDLTELARSFTSIYQPLPTYPCYDPGDGQRAYVDESDIPNLDRAKAKAALDFHREIRAAVDEHLGNAEYIKGRYDLGRVVGIEQPTQQSAVWDGDAVRLLRTIADEDPGGDGTVPRSSATPLEDEEDEGAAFSAERHASLQNDDHVLLQLTGMLTGYAIDWSQFRGVVPTIDLSLDVDDLYSDADALLVRVRPIGDPPEGLMAVSVDVESGEERRRRQLTRRDDGWHEAELGPLPEGVYRVTVFGAGAVDPATDLVTVLAD